MVDLFQAIHSPVFAHIVLPLPAGLWHRERPGISRSEEHGSNWGNLVEDSFSVSITSVPLS